MSLASEKARYYLEKSVPELQELEKKNLFSKDEIATIIRRRTEFEHKLNARGSTPGDYARYAEFEMNLETLRKKRAKRLDVKMKSFAGTRRVFFILERSTKKFPGDIGLWMQYIEVLRKEGAHKKVEEALTSCVRLHPSKSALWIYAAKYFIDVQSDIKSAREYLQKGLRFCSHSKDFWLEYTKVEIMFTARIWSARRIIGFDANSDAPEKVEGGQLEDLAKGAIPLAVFDSAMNSVSEESFAGSFFDLFAEVKNAEAAKHMSDHVISYMILTWPKGYIGQVAYVRQPLIGTPVGSSNFPAALRECFPRLKEALSKVSDPSEFTVALTKYFVGLLNEKQIDTSVRSAILLVIRSLMQNCENLTDFKSSAAADACKILLSSNEIDVQETGNFLLTRAIKIWPEEEGLLHEQATVLIH